MQVDLVEANACQSAVEATRCLLLHRRWCPPGGYRGYQGPSHPHHPSNSSGGDGGTSVRVCLRLRFPRGRTLVAASLLLLACSVSRKTRRCFALTFMKTTLLPQNFRFQLPNFQLFHIKPHRVCSKSSFILQGL